MDTPAVPRGMLSHTLVPTEDYTTETLLQDAEGLLKISCQLTGPSAEAASIRFSLGDLEAGQGLAIDWLIFFSEG